jgi:hypothetical protein
MPQLLFQQGHSRLADRGASFAYLGLRPCLSSRMDGAREQIGEQGTGGPVRPSGGEGLGYLAQDLSLSQQLRVQTARHAEQMTDRVQILLVIDVGLHHVPR